MRARHRYHHHCRRCRPQSPVEGPPALGAPCARTMQSAQWHLRPHPRPQETDVSCSCRQLAWRRWRAWRDASRAVSCDVHPRGLRRLLVPASHLRRTKRAKRDGAASLTTLRFESRFRQCHGAALDCDSGESRRRRRWRRWWPSQHHHADAWDGLPPQLGPSPQGVAPRSSPQPGNPSGGACASASERDGDVSERGRQRLRGSEV
mmetsp:Transcript_7243/g.17976  ORF Transcript_7243/g.17976 Transcript_7243/m.17976 type:complete len:205 (-) Transcript_7243:15-629(-)